MSRKRVPRSTNSRQGVRHVLMTADPIGGVWTYAIELIGALRVHGIEVTLATMGRPLDRRQRSATAKLPNLTLRESTYKLEWMQDPWDEVDRAGEWLREIAAQSGVDLVHLNGYAHAALHWRVPVVVGAHSCVYSWFSAVRRGTPPPEWQTYHRRVSAGLRRADAVVAPSAAMLHSLGRFYGRLAARRLHVIHNGRTAPAFFPREYKRDIIVSAGRIWDEAKNARLLDRIAPSLRWPVWMAGEETHPEEGIGGMSCSGLRPLGQLDERELGTVFGFASIFVSAALYEPFGLAALEAGLSGCALVLPAIESSKEIWGDHALYASPHSPDAYIAALRSLIRSPRMRNEYGRRALQRALQLTATAMGDAYAQLYARTVTRGRLRLPSQRACVLDKEESLTA
ncbi:MAG: glycosyltransferase [Chitinivibrionales bacterium]|nr:glycosyltransferase [Chitinivibrionales bacterium]